MFYAQSTGTGVPGRSRGAGLEMNMIRRGAAVVALSEVSLNSGLKGGHRWGCGNSFEEAVPLGDGAGGEGLLPVLGPVKGHVFQIQIYITPQQLITRFVLVFRFVVVVVVFCTPA